MTLPENCGQIGAGRWHFAFLSSWRSFLGMAFMCCSSRPSRAGETGAGGSVSRAVAVVFVLILAVAAGSPPAQAQVAPPLRPPPPPPPPPAPTPAEINSDISAGAALTNLGSNFLERLGNQATSGFGRVLRNNPGGGGASEATDGPRFRTWPEASLHRQNGLAAIYPSSPKFALGPAMRGTRSFG